MTAPMQPAALQGLVEPGVNRRRFGQPDLAGLLLSLGVLLRPLADRLKEFQAPFGRCRSGPLTDTGRQAVRTSRTGQYRLQLLSCQGIYEGAPIIPGRLLVQLPVIGFQTEIETGTAVEGMLAEHALCPAVDSMDCRLIHAAGGQLQTPRQGWPLAFGKGVPQLQQQCIVGPIG